MLKIPIITHLFCFITSVLIQIFVKKIDVKYILQAFVAIFVILFSISHATIVPSINLSLSDVSNFGFLSINSETKSFALIAIIIYTSISFGEGVFKRMRFISILLFAGIYSMPFSSSASGIEISLMLYLVAHTIISISIVQDVLSGTRVMAVNALSYVAISYGLYSIEYSFLITIGCMLHLFILPIFSNVTKMDNNNYRTLAILQSISTIICLCLILQTYILKQSFFQSSQFVKINTIISILTLSYSTYYGIKSKSIVKSIFFISMIVFASFIGSLGKNSSIDQVISYSAQARSSLISVFLLSIVTKVLFRHKNNEKIDNSYILAYMVSLLFVSNLPILSPSTSMTLDSSYFATSFYILSNIVLVIISIQNYKNFKNQIPCGNSEKIIPFSIYYKFCISLIIVGILCYNFQIKNLNFNEWLFRLIFYFMLVFLGLKLLKKDQNEIQSPHLNKIDILLYRSASSFATVYEATSSGINNLIENASNLLKNDIKTIKAIVNDNKESSFKSIFKIQPVVYVIAFTGFITIIKLLSR